MVALDGLWAIHLAREMSKYAVSLRYSMSYELWSSKMK